MSLKRVSEKLGEQNDLMIEVATDIYDYMDTVLSKIETSGKKLDTINTSVLKVAQSFQINNGSGDGDDLEEKRDGKLADKRMFEVLSGIQKNTKGSTSKGSFKESAGKGIGAGVGAGLGFALKGLGAVATLGALGFGIGAFFTGLAVGDKAQAMIGTDMSATKKNMITLGEAFAETPTEGLLAMGVLAGVGAKFGSMKGALNMGLFGAGIGAFFGGLALGDKGMSLLNTDGSALKNMMVSLGEGLNAFSGASLVALGGLIAFGSAFGSAAAVGLPLLGLGLAGFFGAFDIAAAAGIDGSGLGTMLGNLATGLAPLSELNGDNLIDVGAGMAALGVGMVALFGGKAIGAVFDFIGNLFGGDDEDMFTKLYNGLQPLSTLNADNLKGLGDISTVIDGLADSLDRLIDTDYDAVNDSIGDFGKTMSYAIPMLAAMKGQGTGENPYVVGDGWFDGQKKLDFSPGLNSFSNEDVQMMNNIASAGTQISSNSSGQQQKSTSAGNVGKLVTEQSAISSSAPVVIMDNSTNTSSSGGGGTTVLGGPISAFDRMDPYFATRTA
jgi:hypothetical protein|tara:strand:+ start:2268 stop:3929 length:1662 start_codon:yes stop_codon:yes gene_type:complete